MAEDFQLGVEGDDQIPLYGMAKGKEGEVPLNCPHIYLQMIYWPGFFPKIISMEVEEAVVGSLGEQVNNLRAGRRAGLPQRKLWVSP